MSDVTVRTERTATGARAVARIEPPSARERDRAAMRELLTQHGLVAGGTELDLLAEAFGAGVYGEDLPSGKAQERVTAAILDALIHEAKRVGWKPAKNTERNSA